MYILPALREQVRNVKKRKKEIEEKLHLVTGTKKRIVRETHQQEEQLDELKAKIKQWKESLRTKQHDKEMLQEQINTNLLEKKHNQSDALQLAQLKNTILPEVLIEAKAKLFSSKENKKQEALASLIKNL
jgi:hypothetical protein